jgi:hypothetical protein
MDDKEGKNDLLTAIEFPLSLIPDQQSMINSLPSTPDYSTDHASEKGGNSADQCPAKQQLSPKALMDSVGLTVDNCTEIRNWPIETQRVFVAILEYFETKKGHCLLQSEILAYATTKAFIK